VRVPGKLGSVLIGEGERRSKAWREEGGKEGYIGEEMRGMERREGWGEREGGREEGREGGREAGREAGREGGREEEEREG
jgi:hypothetical protein